MAIDQTTLNPLPQADQHTAADLRAVICGGCRGLVRIPAAWSRPAGWLLLIPPADAAPGVPPEIPVCSTDCAERWLRQEGERWRLS